METVTQVVYTEISVRYEFRTFAWSGTHVFVCIANSDAIWPKYGQKEKKIYICIYTVFMYDNNNNNNNCKLFKLNVCRIRRDKIQMFVY